MTDDNKLKVMADKLRIHSIISTTYAGSGHPSTCMSCAELMSVLFFDQYKKDDEFILSKGHAAPILWAAYAEAGMIPIKQLNTLRKISSNLEGHPTPLMEYVKVATGSLGQGLSAGIGMALAKRMKKKKGNIYVLLGDGELAEGSVWEAANSASFFNLNNIIAILDINRLGQTQETMHGHHLDIYKKKFEAFGWETMIIDGHNIAQVKTAFWIAQKSKKPFAIIAKTLKGKGFSEIEDKERWHGKPLPKDMMERALKEIPFIDIKLKSQIKKTDFRFRLKEYKLNRYKTEEKVATRQAFGNALIKLGKANKEIVVIDGDVQNSTYSDIFFKTFPNRAFQSFIAEQNMVGMALGMSKSGLVPFVGTFAAFLTRAHDFIRMALYSKANIKFFGSHAGVSIGEDGPSQMGLEDISMFLSIPDSLILYPCDAVSTEHLVKEMAKHKGISYIRTTREKTPVIYKNTETFPLGKFKVLKKSKKDSALVIAAGITLHEALKAHNILKKQGINIRIIDLYCISPIDKTSLQKHAKECNNKVIVVEDHYFNGIGSVITDAIGKITHLYVKSPPRSGKPEELLKKYGIDSQAIINAVKK